MTLTECIKVLYLIIFLRVGHLTYKIHSFFKFEKKIQKYVIYILEGIFYKFLYEDLGALHH